MVNGIIIINKEQGFTSFDVVAKLRGIVKQKKIGHTGTLDPDAVGVLPVCLGNATKLCDLLTDKSKEYVTEFILGKTTDTQDISGKVLSEHEVTVSESEVRDAVMSFVGAYDQIPPMYSALKINGKKLYELAREGKVVERKARRVEIPEIEIESVQLPYVKMRVACSKGTYIRTLCADIGDKLGCGATMTKLQRTQVGPFVLSDAYTLSEVEQLVLEDRLHEILRSSDSVFGSYRACRVKEQGIKMLRNGNKLFPNQVEEKDAIQGHEKMFFETDEQVRIYNEQDVFVAIYQYKKDERCLKPVKMFLE